MPLTTATDPSRVPRRSGRVPTLSGRARKGVLLVHIAAAGTWLGIDVVMAVVVFTAVLSDDPRTVALCYQALRLFTVWPLLVTGLVCLASGIWLGLGTKYGLLKYWWVAVKLALNLLLTGLVLVALRPTVTGATEFGRQLAAGHPGVPPRDMIYPPIVSPLLLVFAFVLAVFKPWGRIRASKHPLAGPPAAGPR
ncbi:hypothetical protein [Actinopolymorpha rutila]|uniref:Putative membrane protein n=1 Tax=Actinopolymorpha rutila TaxID=446787 RepID=A0A852ZHZ2_9ACTN|nr:hypothetical protein [Actinopolymorpha rutila]NYH92741.1 putative membrane protein [Actinopolymorpha rutila]